MMTPFKFQYHKHSPRGLDYMAKKEEVPITYRFSDWAQYEYIARLARYAGHNQLKRSMDAMLFPEGWKVKLSRLRSIQRKAGLSDDNFYSASQKRALGIKEKSFGRHVIREDAA